MQETPFYSNYNHHPKLDVIEHSKSTNLVAKEFATKMAKLQATIKTHLEKAQQRYKLVANELKKEHPPFQVGDKVWLLWCNIKTNMPYDKLDYQRLKPFVFQK